MNLTAAWQRHVIGPSGSELEQALLRVLMGLLVTLYVCWYVSREAGFIDEHDRIALTPLAVWLILAIGIFAAIWIWPSANVARRMLGILADVGAITFGLLVMGGGGVVLVGTYLFIIFGNGFWYGRLYLHVSQLLSFIGFVLLVSMVPGGGTSCS
jgi:two-component system sensor histidine kinase RpfC